MSLITNADKDLRLDPAIRQLLEVQSDQQDLMQEVESRGKAAARRKDYVAPTLSLEAQDSKVEFEGQAFDDATPSFMLDEPEYDESLASLPVIRRMECTWWPFRAAGRSTGLRPVMLPGAWEATFAKWYCLRCQNRHSVQNPERCEGCELTRAHSVKAFEHLERVGETRVEQRTNRAERRAAAKGSGGFKRHNSGIMVPGGY